MSRIGSLTRYAPLMREPDPCGAERLAKKHWHDNGAIAFSAAQIKRMPWQDRELLMGIASKHYGRRNPKA